MDEREQPSPDGRQRLDKWLFFTRLTKSRALAQKRISDGHVRVNGRSAVQASSSVRQGDRIELLSWRGIQLYVHTVTVLAPGTHRGPYSEARLLYDDKGSVLSDED